MQSLATVAHDDTVLGYEHVPQYQDVWVTVFGFSQADTALILKEMGKCGDILQWGTFGSPAANFLHVQFQNKYASQRALLRSGEQLSPSLIIGIKVRWR
jgi:nuclear pore complex protein Nup53